MTDFAPAPQLPGWLEKLVPFKRYRVPVGNYFVHVMEVGEGRPVVAFHGNPTWGILYRDIATRLAAKQFRVIMPDLIGLGFSSKPRDGDAHTLEFHADVMADVLDQLDLENYITVGQDWGGPIGFLASARAKTQPSGLVILNTVFGPPRPGFKPTLFHRFSHVPLVSDFVFRRLGFPQTALWTAQGDKRSITGDVAKAYRYPLKGYERNVAPLALARMVPDSMEHPSIKPLGECFEFVTNFSGPVGVVWGRKDPVLGGVFKYARKVLPNARFTETGAGHFLQEEVPDEIADAVLYVDSQIDVD